MKNRRVQNVFFGYLCLASLSALLFFAERNQTSPSGIGICFGPLNYFYPSFEFGISRLAICFNVFMLIGAICLSFISELWKRWVAYFVYMLVWFFLGLMAHIYQGEWPVG